MQSFIKTFPQWGRVLWLSDGVIEIGAALDFGIRIVHLSCAGMENLFYEQPADCSDGFRNENGWRIYGGHRLWMAPESELTYAPDNAPVEAAMETDGVLLRQRPDPLLGVEKSIRITLLGGGAARLEHSLRNCSDRVAEGASWGVNTLAGGGVAEADFTGTAVGDETPSRTIALWADTNLGDPRLQFTKDRLIVRHKPSRDYFKLGLYSRKGRASYRNKGQMLELSFEAGPMEQYPDRGSNFELYMNAYFMELETLGPKRRLRTGECARHTETWKLAKAAGEDQP